MAYTAYVHIRTYVHTYVSHLFLHCLLLDIKECSNRFHNCQQKCVELEGGFSCACFDGFELQNDSVSCKGNVLSYLNSGNYFDYSYADIDECKLGTSRCQQICINTNGSYNCDCQSGFQLNTTDNYTCIGMYI